MLGRANPAAARQLGAILVRRGKETDMNRHEQMHRCRLVGRRSIPSRGGGVDSAASLAARPGVRPPEGAVRLVASASLIHHMVYSLGQCGSGCRARSGRAPQVVVSLRSLLQDRMAALNGRTVEYVLKQDLAAFVRLIGLSVAQVGRPGRAGIGYD
jgi:hypothetical protein